VATVEKSVNVDVPVKVAYNLWAHFESFPQFMEGVEAVRQIGDRDLQWRVNIGGKVKEFETEITEQIPEKRIAWRTRGGTDNAGVVTFHHINDAVTRIMLQMEYEPEGVVEKVGDMIGVVSRRIQGDLERFKERVERFGDTYAGRRHA
jgi:uncharacterized membrane protein